MRIETLCQQCETQFTVFANDFDEHLASYQRVCNAGLVLDTPAQRVRDTALLFQEFSETETGRLCTAWYLAIALERLVALEMAGVPT